MNKEDLKKGEVYYTSYDYGWIIKLDSVTEEGMVKHKEFMHLGAAAYIGKEPGSWGDFKTQFSQGLRLATPDEKQWLKNCIKQNKVISFEETKITYPIYL